MSRSRIVLVVVSVMAMAVLYWLPKAVVENDSQLKESAPVPAGGPHGNVPDSLRSSINQLRTRYLTASSEEKNAIFADSLAAAYARASMFDSAAWYAEKAAMFFGTPESAMRAGNAYYDAFTFSVDKSKQSQMAAKTQEWLGKVLAQHPDDLDAKTRMAMTFVTSSAPMKGIQMLREVLAVNPDHQQALFSMGMLSVQSGQNEKAVEWLGKLAKVNPQHVQGQLLLGVAFLNLGQKDKAKLQFEKVKEMDKDPSVQATVDSYLEELK